MWNESDSETENDCQTSSGEPSLPNFEDHSCEYYRSLALCEWLIGFLVTLQAKFYFPDSALNIIVKFFSAFFTVLGQTSPFMELLAKNFPSSLHNMRKKIGKKDSFSKYIVCTKCSQIYLYADCVDIVGSLRLSKHCLHVKYPDHPHAQRRRSCGNLLLKSVEISSGKKLLYPFKVYSYKSIQDNLQHLLLRSEFYENCQHWRNQIDHNHIDNVYDGSIWKEFQEYSGSPFLSSPYSFAFILNVDWFQPYTHTTFSVGVIYLTILNLPRTLRYKRENILLLGIIPGPHEPKLNINSFLYPMVKEMLEFWNGMKLSVLTKLGIKDVLVKAAIWHVIFLLVAKHVVF